MAGNGADRRVGGIGPKCGLERKWPDLAGAAIGTVPCHLGPICDQPFDELYSGERYFRLLGRQWRHPRPVNTGVNTV